MGTERGAALLDKSIGEDGAGRSLLATADDVIIAGNKTLEALIERGIEQAIVVHTDGSKAVIVQRDDVEHGTPRAQRMAVMDNRTAEVGLDWSPEVLEGLGIDLTDMFYDNELKDMGIGADEAGEVPVDRMAELRKRCDATRQWAKAFSLETDCAVGAGCNGNG